MEILNEYEIKIKINNNKEIFNEIKEICDTKFEIIGNEKSINYMMNLGINKTVIRTNYYNNKCQKLTEFDIYKIKEKHKTIKINNKYEYKKTPIILSLTHSTEKNIKNYIINNGFYRFKDRISYKINEEFRIDLTLIKTETEYTNINTIINKFFKNSSTTNFTNKENYIDNYEIEIEYIGEKEIDINYIENNISYILSNIYIYNNPLNELYFLLFGSESNTNLTFQKITNKVITLDKYNYYKPENNIYMFDKYFITEKTDGERVLILIIYYKLYIIYSDKKINKEYTITNTNTKLILDGEYINKKSLNKEEEEIYIFDVLYCNNIKVSEYGFKDRISYFDECKKITDKIDIYTIKYKKLEQIDNSVEKQNIKTLANKYYKNNNDKTIDGLIFYQPYQNYYKCKIYKWKPLEMNTIDFYCLLDKKININNKITYKYKIYSYLNINTLKKMNINKTNIIDIPKDDKLINILFQPSINPLDYIFETNLDNLDNKIVELKKDNVTFKWIFVKERFDKNVIGFGNYFTIAEQMYMNYYNPLNFEMLYNKETDNKNNYFNSSIKNNSVIWNNKVKHMIFDKYLKNTKILLDLGCGRGGDINKYNIYNIESAILIELDIMAIQELIIDRKVKSMYNATKITNLNIVNLDLKMDYLGIYDDVINKTNIKKVDNILINFALHYFSYTDSLLGNIINYINISLKPKGLVVITLMNGKKVFDFLKNNNNRWKSKNSKYMIEFTNQNDIKKNFNRYIDISLKLPMSNDMLYSEKLLDINYIIKCFKKNKFILIDNVSFLKYDVKNVELDDDDKKWVDFYELLVFQKK